MAIPTTFSPVQKQDFTLTPIKVHKKFAFSGSVLENEEDGYKLVEGYYSKIITPIGSAKADNDPKNPDGSFKHVIWHSINHLYYENPYNPFATHEHYNARYTSKFLNVSASLLSIPYMDFGEGIKKQSVIISNHDLDLMLIDDGYGNLYDPALETSLSAFSRNGKIGYWGFNGEYKQSKRKHARLATGSINFESIHLNKVECVSQFKNVSFIDGLEIDSEKSGLSAAFCYENNIFTSSLAPGYIKTDNNDYFNFDSTEAFTISFWIYPSSTTGIQPVITKNGVEFTNQYGTHDRILDSGQVTQDTYISSSYADSLTDVYPFDVAYDASNENIIVKRSDGLRTLTLSGSIDNTEWNHISIVRYTDGEFYYFSLIINGTDLHTVIDTTIHPINKKCLMFGKRQQHVGNGFIGALDEIRFTDYAQYDVESGLIDLDYYSEIALPEHAYNTSVVGNVFYRQGNIVLSPLYPKYKEMLSGSWEMSYRGTHTIYQYEILCRIKKGDFNLTLNPTARKSPKSDMLIDDMTGSLMTPYFTTIGLYNDANDLVAVAKTSQAIATRPDVDINLLIRFDT